LRAYNVSWLCHDCSFTAIVAHSIPSAVCETPPEDKQVMLETCRGPWFSINWMKSASRWFHYTDKLWCTVSKTLSLPRAMSPNDISFQDLRWEVLVYLFPVPDTAFSLLGLIFVYINICLWKKYEDCSCVVFIIIMLFSLLSFHIFSLLIYSHKPHTFR
jgi:hypothetical protein